MTAWWISLSLLKACVSFLLSTLRRPRTSRNYWASTMRSGIYWRIARGLWSDNITNFLYLAYTMTCNAQPMDKPVYYTSQTSLARLHRPRRDGRLAFRRYGRKIWTKDLVSGARDSRHLFATRALNWITMLIENLLKNVIADFFLFFYNFSIQENN